MSYNKVIYLGIIKDEQKNIVGGFAVANERNIYEYKRRGFHVEIIKYPFLKNKDLVNIIKYVFNWWIFICQSIFICFQNKNLANNTLIHFTPFYKYFLIVEYPVVKLIKLFNKNILIDIRAGSFITYYENYGFFYRKLLSAFLKQAKYITVEGEKYLQFIKEKVNTKAALHYYPNYVKDEQILLKQRIFGGEPLKLIYFGRITPEKGIDTLIEIHYLLKIKYKVETTIIGSGERNYLNFLKNNIDKSDIVILPPQDIGFINQKLADSHFFVFPTTHKSEGHSNSLTESMARGVVPIATDNGFNKDVILNAGVVMPPNTSAQQYYEEIDSLIVSEMWEEYSERSRKRIASNFSNSIVSSSFFQFINNSK